MSAWEQRSEASRSPPPLPDSLWMLHLCELTGFLPLVPSACGTQDRWITCLAWWMNRLPCEVVSSLSVAESKRRQQDHVSGMRSRRPLLLRDCPWAILRLLQAGGKAAAPCPTSACGRWGALLAKLEASRRVASRVSGAARAAAAAGGGSAPRLGAPAPYLPPPVRPGARRRGFRGPQRGSGPRAAAERLLTKSP